MWSQLPRPMAPPRMYPRVRSHRGPFWLAGRAWAAASVQTHLSLMPLVKVPVQPAEFARPEASSCTSWLSIDPGVAPTLLSMNNRRTSDAAASSRPCAPAPALAELTDAGQLVHQDCSCESLSTPTGTRWPKLAARLQACEARQRDEVNKGVAIVLPQILCYLKFSTGVVRSIRTEVVHANSDGEGNAGQHSKL